MMHISVGRAYYISILLSTAAGTGSWSEAPQLACRAAGWDWDELDMSQTDRQAQRIPISTSAAAAAVTACRAHRAGAGAMLPHPHHTVADRHHHPSGLLQPTSPARRRHWPPTLCILSGFSHFGQSYVCWTDQSSQRQCLYRASDVKIRPKWPTATGHCSRLSNQHAEHTEHTPNL